MNNSTKYVNGGINDCDIWTATFATSNPNEDIIFIFQVIQDLNYKGGWIKLKELPRWICITDTEIENEDKRVDPKLYENKPLVKARYDKKKDQLYIYSNFFGDTDKRKIYLDYHS